MPATAEEIIELPLAVSQEVRQTANILQKKDSFSALTTDETEAIIKTLAVREDALIDLQDKGLTLRQSILYAQLEKEFGFTIEELLENCPTPDEGQKLFREMEAYRRFLHQDFTNTEVDHSLRQYLLSGFTFGQVKNAYIIQRTLGIPMDQLLRKSAAETLYPEDMSEISRNNFRLFARDLGVNEQALVDYAVANNKTFKRLEKLINNGYLYEIQLREPQEFQRILTEQQAIILAKAQQIQSENAGGKGPQSPVAGVTYTQEEQKEIEQARAEAMAAEQKRKAFNKTEETDRQDSSCSLFLCFETNNKITLLAAIILFFVCLNIVL